MKAASGMNFHISSPQFVEMRDDNPNTYVDCIENVMSRQKPSLIFCVAFNNRLDRYAAIKKKCCVDRPVPTQVLLSKSLQNKSLMSIATKVAIQLNCKIGGIPWSINIPLSGLMVVGFDVCHDTNSKTKDFGTFNLTCCFISIIFMYFLSNVNIKIDNFSVANKDKNLYLKILFNLINYFS